MKLIVTALLLFSILTFPADGCAVPTTTVTILGNLDASGDISVVPPNPDSWVTLGDAANFSTTFDIYDSRLIVHTVTLFFFRAAAGLWETRAYVSGSEVGETSDAPALVGTLSMTFTSSGSQSSEQAVMTLQASWIGGATSLVNVYLSPFTQFTGPSSISVISQNGGPSDRRGDDYDGDGFDDYAIWRPSSGYWAILKSSTNNQDYLWIQWGLPGDFPMSGDYTGDRHADLVVWRPESGNWYICKSESDFDCSTGIVQQFGLPGDVPVRKDYDGDGVLDFAVWRKSTQHFYYKGSRDGTAVQPRQWGSPGDIPLAGSSND